MANIILANGIMNNYSNKVAEYMSKGLRIHVNSMSGSQGEVAKIDLTDGKDVYRISLTRECSYGDFYGDIYQMTVERFDDMAQEKNLDNFHCTIWNGKGDTVEEKRWFSVGNDRQAFTDNLEEAQEMHEKNFRRWKERQDSMSKVTEINLTDERVAFIKNICRRFRGYGKIKNSDIESLEKIFEYNGFYYKVKFADSTHKNSLVIKRRSL